MSRSVLRERGPTDIRTRHILLAEDNDDDRAWIKGMLCGANAAVSVTSVATGDEILEHVRRHGVDCVVLDYRLEAEDGLDILAKLKALSPFLPVIMLTGQGNEEVAAKCIRVGAAEYLIKQRLNETYLSAAIENAMSRAALEAKVAEQEEQRRRFLSTLVHDLRAPLRNVRRLGEFAVEEANSGDLIEMQELLSMQSSIAARATDLIEMLESYALLDGNVTFRTLSLTEAAEAAKANLAAIIAERQAEVVIGAMPDILGHAPQLMQMFQNLIGNGLKYNDSGSPRIDIKVEEQSVGMLTVVVRDNGIGVPHKHLKTIFSPLKRLWGQDTYEGSGLGLAICQKIVERHGGTIWCTSVEGQGSAFHIRLPSTD